MGGAHHSEGHKALHRHPEARELNKQIRSVELSLEGCSGGSSAERQRECAAGHGTAHAKARGSRFQVHKVLSPWSSWCQNGGNDWKGRKA